MTNLLRLVLLASSIFVMSIASAYNLKYPRDGVCEVYCNTGQLVGTMYWNGSKWSDGIRSDSDENVVARQIVAAQGSYCQ